jgi:hypothetical protein
MLVGPRLQENPVGEVVRVRATVPAYPFTGAIVMVRVAVVPVGALTLAGFAVTE